MISWYQFRLTVCYEIGAFLETLHAILWGKKNFGFVGWKEGAEAIESFTFAEVEIDVI